MTLSSLNWNELRIFFNKETRDASRQRRMPFFNGEKLFMNYEMLARFRNINAKAVQHIFNNRIPANFLEIFSVRQFSAGKMERATIESLNDDVLLEVFKFLDVTSLKACTLVSHG